MATHSSTLAQKIPWVEEPGGLQSMGSQRVRHDFMNDRDKWNVKNEKEKQHNFLKLENR